MSIKNLIVSDDDVIITPVATSCCYLCTATGANYNDDRGIVTSLIFSSHIC